jgi:hypothetical protein
VGRLRALRQRLDERGRRAHGGAVLLRAGLLARVRSVLNFGVQNPCTAIGLSAPEFGVVILVNASGRLACAWFCREDMVKVPYNSAPPTRAQVNASTREYAELPVKYECLAPPPEWTATVFGLTMETEMLLTEGEYAQTLFDAVDRLAAAVRRSLVGDCEGIVLLSVASDFIRKKQPKFSYPKRYEIDP